MSLRESDRSERSDTARELDLAAAAVEQAQRALPGADVDAGADRTLVGLTRFATSIIHQNVAEDTTTVRLRIHHDGRTATSSVTVTGVDDLPALVERTVAAVQVAPRDPGWPGVAPVAEVPDTPAVDVATAEAAPAVRAELVRGFVDGAGGLETAGFCRTAGWWGGFADSAGQTASLRAGECSLAGIARADGADGVARHAPLTIAELDGITLGARAAAKARAWRDPIELPPDRYEVVLEPTAVADLVETMAAVGFNGRFVTEGRSFARLGEAQLDPAITMIDDPLPLGHRYDIDGTPRRRFPLVEAGTTVGLTHDRRTAAEAGAGTVSTGHAAFGRFSWGPTARHVELVPAGAVAGPSEVDGAMADSSVAALVAGVERGILVSDLWYTRLLDTRTMAVTGLTRNGVWLIEQGQISAPVRNFRFTQSYVQALMPGNVVAVGATATPVPGDTYTATSPRWTCPALHLASWNFTGGASG